MNINDINLVLLLLLSKLYGIKGTDVEPFYKDPQAAAAAGMEKVAEQINSQFVLALGDNFYHSGLSSLDSDRFQTTFEDVYSDPHLQNSWFVTAGNHGKFVFVLYGLVLNFMLRDLAVYKLLSFYLKYTFLSW